MSHGYVRTNDIRNGVVTIEKLNASLQALLVDRRVQAATDVSVLQTLVGTIDGEAIVLDGYHASGDGGGGVFYCDPTPPSSARIQAAVAVSVVVSNATNATPIVVTTATHSYTTGQSVVINGVLGNTAANGTWRIIVLSATTFSLVGSVGNGAWTSGGTSNTVTVTTSAAHGIVAAQPVMIAGVVGMTEINTRSYATRLSNTQFSIGVRAVSTYTSGGVIGDGGISIPSGTARWHRVIDGPYSVKWFGAVGDGVTDDSLAVQGAVSALTHGGDIIFPSGNTFLIGSTIDVNRPLHVDVNAGAHLVGASGVDPMFSMTAGASASGNFSIVGADPKGSSITSNGGTIFRVRGDYYNYVESGKQSIIIRSLTLDGDEVADSVMLDMNDFPTLNFQNGLVVVEDCAVLNFRGIAIDIGASVYFVRITRNEILNNYVGLSLGNNTEAAVTENNFGQATDAIATIISVGPMHRICNNYFYRFGGASTSAAPDILLQPHVNWTAQAGGTCWILDNRFGSEAESLHADRTRIRLYSSNAALTGGTVLCKGNFFLGPSFAVTSISGNGTVATITLALSNLTPTTGLVPGESLVTISSAGNAGFNGTYLVKAGSTVTSTTFQIEHTLNATAAGGLVGLADGHAISLENGCRAWDISENFFANYAILVNDAQPQYGSGGGQSIFSDNRVVSPTAGYRVFANEGRGFQTIRLGLEASTIPFDTEPRRHETLALQNRITASEALNTWTANNGIVVTTGQADPYGTTRAFLLDHAGAIPFQNIAVSIYTADLADDDRLVVKFWGKAGTSSTVVVGIYDATQGDWMGDLYTVNLGADWKQYKFISNGLPDTGHSYTLNFYPDASSSVEGSVYLFAPMASDYDSDYIPNTAAASPASKVDDASAGNRYEQALIVPFIKTSQTGYGNPTITGSGVGASPTFSVDAGSTDMAGVLSITPGGAGITTPESVTLTYHIASTGYAPVVVAMLDDTGTAWPSGTVLRVSAASVSSFTLTWSTTLTTGLTYKIRYIVIGR